MGSMLFIKLIICESNHNIICNFLQKKNNPYTTFNRKNLHIHKFHYSPFMSLYTYMVAIIICRKLKEAKTKKIKTIFSFSPFPIRPQRNGFISNDFSTKPPPNIANNLKFRYCVEGSRNEESHVSLQLY